MNNHRLSLFGFLIQALVVVGLGAGCTSPAMTSTPVQSPPVAASRTLSVPTVTASATQPPSPTATPTPTPIQTPVSTVMATLEQVCPSQETELPTRFLVPGVMIFREDKGSIEASDHHLSSLYLPDLSLRPFLSDLASGFIGVYQVSPDGRWLVLGHEKLSDGQSLDHDLLVTTSDVQTLKTIPWDKANWSYNILGWTPDSQRLVIVPKGAGDNIIVFNPFTRQEQRIIPSFTYSDSPPLSDETWGGVNVAYDPSLSRVMYLDNSTTMILWDVPNKRELWRMTNIYASAVFPEWSPDGEYVAIVTSALGGNNELSLVSRDGDERISVLAANYPIKMFRFAWSPNGRYLTYWAPGPQGGNDRLLFFDRTTRKHFDPCLESAIPVWSPDSKQFMVGFSEPKTGDNAAWVFHNLVVDVEQKRIAPFDAVTLEPVAWIRTEP